MKRLYIIVEGQTEKEFVKSMLAPYLQQFGIFLVVPVLIRTSKTGRGGFVNYQHLKNDIYRLLRSLKDDIVVSMLVDFFKMPEVPYKERWERISFHSDRVSEMEKCIADDINDYRFIPYIQLHEFEALLFSSNRGFETYFTSAESQLTQQVIDAFDTPEDINSTPEGAPSKRLLSIKSNYEKVIDGNLLALEVGIKEILSKCPRFKAWVELLIEKCSSNVLIE